MAMASRAPNLRDTERVDVTTHALEKLRERLPAGSHLLSVPEGDLRLRVEEAWKNAQRGGLVEEWWERSSGDGEPVCNFVVDFSDSFDAPLFGLYREDDRQPGKPVLITVLAKHMVEGNKSGGRWAKTPEEIGERRNLTTNPFRGPLANRVLPPAPSPIAAPGHEPTSDIIDLEKILVVYQHPESRDELFIVTTRGRLPNMLQELVDKGVQENTFQFWGRREVRIKKKIEVAF